MADARTTLHLALALLAAGGLFGLPSLYVPAIALGLLSAGAFVWVRAAARTARVSPLPGPSTVQEGDPYPLRLEVEWGSVPPPGGELSHPALAEPVVIRRVAEGLIGGELRFERWGPRRVEPARVEVRDPLGLHRREVRGDPGETVLVLPRTEPVRAPAETNGGNAPQLLGGVLGERAKGRATWAIDPEIDGVRPWRPGSPASRIHWPSVARTGELFERALEGGADSAPLVVLDPGRAEDEQSLRMAVRAAASLCLHLARAGGCALLLPGEARALTIDRKLRSWPRAHARLALMDPEGSRPVEALRRAGAIIWVTTSGRVPPRTRRADRGGGYLVTPATVRGARPAFEVAGCRGYPLAAIASASAGTVVRPTAARP